MRILSTCNPVRLHGLHLIMGNANSGWAESDSGNLTFLLFPFFWYTCCYLKQGLKSNRKINRTTVLNAEPLLSLQDNFISPVLYQSK